MPNGQGEPIDYIIPDATILIENPIALTTSGDRSVQARAFVNFLLSPDGQRIFGKAGYRPVRPEIAGEFSYPQPAQLFTIDDLGGWTSVESSLFDRQSGLVARTFASQGISQGGN